MIYLTGGGMTPKTMPILITGREDLGALAQPGSNGLGTIRRFPRWAADNGCFAQGKTFDAIRWLDWLGRMAEIQGSCLFATAPDVVGDAEATLARSTPYLPQLRGMGYKPAFVAQDGSEDMALPWSDFDCLFLGGSTEWKLSHAAVVVTTSAKAKDKWVHMGRVNSLRRLDYATMIGCDSADGNYLAFGPDTNLPKMLRWLDRINRNPHLGLYAD